MARNTRKPEFMRETTYRPPSSCVNTADSNVRLTTTWTGPSELLLGYTTDELKEDEVWLLEHVHPEDTDHVIQAFVKHLAPFPDNKQCSEARLWSVDYRFRRKDGSYVLVSERGITARDDAGYVTTMNVVIFDKHLQRTQRMAHKKDLESRNYLSVVAENTPSGIFLMDSMGYCIYMNNAAEQITGFKLEELFDYTFHASCHSCKRDGSPYPIHECPVFHAQQTGTSVKDASEVFVHKSGHFYDIVFSVSPVGEYGSSGSVIEFRDVSDQRRIEKERLEAILESQQTALMLKSTESHKEAMSSFISFICHELRNPLQGITASAEFLLESVSQLKKDLADDKHQNADSKNWPPTVTLIEGRDSKYSNKLDKVEKMLEDAQSLIANIQTCADHQALIINNTLDLSRLEAGKAEPSLEIIDILAVGAQCITMMTAKAHAKSVSLKLADPDRLPLYIFGDATMLTQVILNLISNAVKFTLRDGTIILNLHISSTSSDSNPKSRKITLHGSVQDNGIGMTETEKGRLFQRFSQGNKKVAQLYGGSGLGLNISRELVRVMGGSMEVESARGVGSTFRFTTVHTVPSDLEMHRFLSRSTGSIATTPIDENRSLNSALGAMAMNETPISESGANGTHTTLPTEVIPASSSEPAPHFKFVGVAEDNPINLSYLAKVLKGLGYDHVLCTNGEELLTQFLEPDSLIDVIIADMHMPVLDGLELTRLVREIETTRNLKSGGEGMSNGTSQQANNHQGIPIIALSGNALTEQVAEAFEAGVSDYLLKPTKKANLVKTLQYWEDIVHKGGLHQPMAESVRTIAKGVIRKPARAGSLGG